MQDNPPRPTDAELEILTVLWSRGPSTVRDIHETIAARKPTQYTTVLKMLQIMTAKGLVVRDEANRAHVYRAAMSQDTMQSTMLRDLSVRLFKYPCSYLIYSKAFAESPSELRDYVWQRLWSVLTDESGRDKFGHLSSNDRRAIIEIVRDTVPNLPEYWKEQ